MNQARGQGVGNNLGDRKITLKEIAEKANVSIGTVDRCLHNRGTISSETAKRIREICREYGYNSNVVGKAMAMRRKGRTIAVVINAISRNEFSAVIQKGLRDFAESVEDYNVRFEYYDLVDGSVEELCQKLDQVSASEVDGLILKPIDTTIVRYKLLKIREEKNIPIVTCTSDIADAGAIAYVGQDHRKLGRMMACTLTKVFHEHLRILVVVGPLMNAARREKLEGFMEYLHHSGRKYEICDICEVSLSDAEACSSILASLQAHRDINALYIHSPQLDQCFTALEQFGEFNGMKFAFGYSGYMADYIRSGKIDFAIYEDPYNQGYLAGETIFDYLLEGIVPEDNKRLLDGQIVFDANC